MRTVSIPANILKHWQLNIADASNIEKIRTKVQSLLKDEPEVSIVIPAYNEEESIIQTLSSISDNITNRSVEIIVVDNNSKDATNRLATEAGVICIRETTQGITPARNRGLSEAKGKYILNADADSIYPPDWIEEMIKPLAKNDTEVALTYGRFSFIPVGSTGRFTYFFYEYIAEFSRWINKTFREEAVNVYGFNSGFRRLQGLQADSFNHPAGTNEDGFLAMKLRNKGFGKLYCVKKSKARVWTTDRRLQIDGGLWKATQKRVKRMMS
ncbi:MAG TPA: glycosyltransferase family 2 protein [Chitinophagaceae bacterium]|nr:glycosyltransferase family 2 protein [Chitinophagaceae bacterium]